MEDEDAPEQQRAFATGADDITSTLAIEPLTSDEDEEDEGGGEGDMGNARFRV